MGKKSSTYLGATLQCKCPRCREGNLFVHKNPYILNKITTMHATCPVCGQPTEIEVGFYYGTGYVSYALTIAFSVATFIAWWVLLGISIMDNSLFYWLATNAVLLIVLQPVFMRLSRSVWISWFVKYDPNWRNHPLENFERNVG